MPAVTRDFFAHLKTTYHKYLADPFAPQVEIIELAKTSEE